MGNCSAWPWFMLVNVGFSGLLCVEESIGCAVECGGVVWIVVGYIIYA